MGPSPPRRRGFQFALPGGWILASLQTVDWIPARARMTSIVYRRGLLGMPVGDREKAGQRER